MVKPTAAAAEDELSGKGRPMLSHRIRALGFVGAALTILAFPTALAHGNPAPAVCPAPATVVDDGCTLRLTSVTADDVNGTITGTPVGGGVPLVLAGQADAYLKSEGFGDSPRIRSNSGMVRSTE